MSKQMFKRIMCVLTAAFIVFQSAGMCASAANYTDTGFLNFSFDSGLIKGHIHSIDGKTDFTVQNGCVVLDGGYTHGEIPIKIQMDANFSYTYCISNWAGNMGQYNTGGVLVYEGGDLDDNWTTEYPRYDGFAHDAMVDISLKYGPYYNVNIPLYGKRTVQIFVRRLDGAGEPEGGSYFNLPLLFVVKKENASASASIRWKNYWGQGSEYPIFMGTDQPLEATWSLGANSNTSAAYQWYKKVNGVYTAINGATGQTYIPTETGDYKVEVTLTVNNILSGVEPGTYKASAEKSVTKANPSARIGWDYKSGSYSQTKTVTLKDAVSLQMSAGAAGKFVIKKDGAVIKEQTISAGQLGDRITVELGEAALSMAGAYTWEFLPENTVFCASSSGSLTLNVNKLASNTSASMSEYISTSDYQGSIEMKADTSGTFTFETEGRSQDIKYTAAGISVSCTELGTLIPEGTAPGTYAMEYKFVPDNAAEYREETGSMSYTIDEAKCNIVIQQVEGGIVKVNGGTEDFRGSVEVPYEILVTPTADSSSIRSSVETVTVNGQALDERALTRNADGSVTASYTVPAEGINKTFVVSATYNLNKLVLKNNQTYYYDGIDIFGIGYGISLEEAEKAVFDTILDAQESKGITWGEDVAIRFYMGINKDVMGNTSERWDVLDAWAINMYGSDLHAFGTQATEKIRVKIGGIGLTGEVTLKILKRSATMISSENTAAVSYDNTPENMQKEMEKNLNASVVSDGAVVSGAELTYTDPNGTAIDWSSVKAGDVVQVKVSYAGIKTNTGGYSPSSKLVDVYIRPNMIIPEVTKEYTGYEILLSETDFSAVPETGNVEAAVKGIEGYYNDKKEACTSIADAGDYYVKLNLEDSYGAFVSDYVPVTVNPAELTLVSAAAVSRVYDGTKQVELKDTVFNNIKGSDDLQADYENSYATVSSKNVGSYSAVTIGKLVLKGDDAKNYELSDASLAASFDLTEPVVISVKDVIIEGASVKPTKEYDGSTDAEITNIGSISEICGTDNLVIVEGTAAYDNKNAGNNKDVSFTGFTLAGSDAGNYSLAAQPSGVKADITAKTLILKTEVADQQFNGTKRETTIVEAEPVNKVKTDDLTLDLSNAKAVFTAAGNADETTAAPVICSGIVLAGKDAQNYTLVQPFEVTGKITADYTAQPNVDYMVNSNDWMNTPFTVKAADGYTVSLTVDGSYSDELSSETVDANGLGALEFYVKAPNGDISRKVTENYKIDKTVPSGTIQIKKNKWTSFLNKVTLGLFYKDCCDVIIHAEDQEGLSGIKTIEYYEHAMNKSEEGLSLDADGRLPLKEAAWKTYDSPVKTIWDEEKVYVYYVRITDHAGNVTYICSEDGIEYDITAPVIRGVTDQQVYYTTKNISVTDRNLDTITLNGEPAASAFSLSNDAETVYEICASDKAGNKTVYTVTIKPVRDLEDMLSGITVDNVQYEDEAIIDEVIRIITNEDLTQAKADEKKVLEDLLKSCNALKEKLEISREIDRAYLAAQEAAARAEAERAAQGKKAPATGDVSGIWNWGMLCMASFSGLARMLKKRKR